MNYKYIILDFGKVLAGPTTGEWYITPKFKEVIDMSLINLDELKEVFKNNYNIISRRMITEKEEYNEFFEFYSSVLKEIGYPKYNDKLAHQIAYNFAYESDKYTFYKNIEKEIKALSKKYKLIMLTDNWPCIERILDEKKLSKYFDKIYVSSHYGTVKSEGTFFNYPIKEYNIKEKEALFIDDMEENLKAAKEKGLDVILMDRGFEVKKSKYKIIHDLLEIYKKKQ